MFFCFSWGGYALAKSMYLDTLEMFKCQLTSFPQIYYGFNIVSVSMTFIQFDFVNIKKEPSLYKALGQLQS